jgi:hypothetical protein
MLRSFLKDERAWVQTLDQFYNAFGH